MIGVILAGGSGTRFWPKSRELAPKQLLPFSGENTLIQDTVERILPIIPIENVYIVTNELHSVETCKQLERYGFAPSRLLAEPYGKNTAPAVCFISKILEKTYAQEVMAVFPADHFVKDPHSFHEAIKKAEQAADRDYLVTLGIHPSRPEIGYGYIKLHQPLDDLPEIYKVEKFVEKPDAEQARKYCSEGNYLWNCGVFIWKVSQILNELKSHMPSLYGKLETITATQQINNGRYPFTSLNLEGQAIYESLDSISIDYGVMEKAKDIAVVPMEIDWNDVGSWTALENLKEKDAAGNILTDNVVTFDSSGSIVQGQDRLIALVGTKDLIVVDTPDAILVCDKKQAQNVRKVVEKIKTEGRPEAKHHTTVQKPWGSYTVLEHASNHLVKRLEVLPGEKLSLQMHNHREEQWLIVRGQAEVQLDEETFLLNKNDSIFIPKGAKHRLGNPGETLLTLVEVQIGDKIEEDDIIRFEDIYGRTNGKNKEV